MFAPNLPKIITTLCVGNKITGDDDLSSVDFAGAHYGKLRLTKPVLDEATLTNVG